ncbi:MULTISPECIES: hypothetical protein [Actinoplanes]|uniref:hypothetical protein n=1 Tax=Actinoplanes TaxID=1865 RepID=UPI0005F28BD4|nr:MULTISPECIES: hypothetical protein [Actinoplanes]GLY07704.1 hypothetical protein Acsp01_80830 [Actinoplanes sp. NBRC 101535]
MTLADTDPTIRYPPPPSPVSGPALVACDLDRTLIYSAAAVTTPAPPLEVAETSDGAPLSFHTRGTGPLLAAIGRLAPLVPVTTRTLDQYRRVRLTGWPPRYAVAANGGHILVDDRVDPAWAGTVAALVGQECAPLGEVHDHLRDAAGADEWLLRVYTADDLFCYAIVERSRLPADWLPELSAWCGQRRWNVSLQGRKVYCMPRPVTKQAAVAEVARRLRTEVLFAAGDSLLDQDLLRAADAGVRPAHGELHERGWAHDRIAVTDVSGVMAGEEIAARLLAYLLHRP